MGRKAETYRIRRRDPKNESEVWKVRFRIDGKRRELSTGTTDRGEADREGRRIYGEELGGKPATRRAAEFQPTAKVVTSWLESLTIRSVDDYEDFAGRWLVKIKRWDALSLSAYIRKRLQESIAKTVRSEQSALRGFLAWLVETGYLAEVPAFNGVPRDAKGVPSKQRTRVAAPDYDEKEIRALLARLPEQSDNRLESRGKADGFWVRPRCELLYEQALRPATVDRLSVPEHWEPGSKTLRITVDIDKEGAARELPLTPKALAALKRCAPKSGLIFGEHKYYRYLRQAAAEALSPGKARLFTGQHLRSARATHLLDAGAPLTGVQYLMGHKKTSTTALYIRPSKKAAAEALRAVG